MSGFLGGGIGPTAIKRRSGLAAPVPVAGASILADGDMEAAGVTSWLAYDAPTTREKSATRVQAGSQSLRLVTAAANQGTQNIISGLSSNWIRANGYLWIESGQVDAQFLNGALNTKNTRLSAAAAWQPALYVGRATTGIRVVMLSVAAAEWYSDSFTAQALTLASLFSTRPYASADCDLSVAVTRTAGTQAGLCARLDSAASPANFLIAYLDGAGNVKVDKCVAGTYTNVISGAVTYAAGRILRLVCSGNNVSCYYNGVQVGSTVTVADAGIVSNTRHGLFSTYAANTFTGYTAA